MSASEFEGHEELIAQLQAGTLDAPDHLHRRVLAGPPAKRRRWAEMSGRKRVLIAVPVAATLAVGAALVHGAFSTSSQLHGAAGVRGPELRPSHGGPAGRSGPTGPKALSPNGFRGVEGANGATGAQGPTGSTGPTGAKGATGVVTATGAYSTFSPLQQARLDAAQGQVPTGSGNTVMIPKGRLVHAVADLQVVVPSRGALTTATNKATAIATQVGGYAQNVEYRASHQGYGSAYLDLRVPLAKTELAIGKLGALGRLVSQSVSTQDLEQQFTKQTNQIGRLQRSITIYKQALQSGTLSGPQRVEVQIRLANAEHELTGTRKSRSHTVASGKTADIRLSLTTKHQAAVVGPHKTGRLGQLLHNAGDFLALEGIIVLYALIVVVPIALLLALIWWLTSGRRRRDEKRLLASA